MSHLVSTRRGLRVVSGPARLAPGRPYIAGLGENMTVEDAVRNDRISAGLNPDGSTPSAWDSASKVVTDFFATQKSKSDAAAATAQAKALQAQNRLANRGSGLNTKTMVLLGVIAAVAVVGISAVASKGSK